MRIHTKLWQMRRRVETGCPLSPGLAGNLAKRVLRVSGSLGTAVMLPATLPLLTCALQTLLPKDTLKNYTVVVPQEQINLYFLAIAAACLIYGLCSLRRLFTVIKHPVILGQGAAEQFGDFFTAREPAGPICLFAAVAIGTGVILAWTLPPMLVSEFVLPFVALEILTFGVGIRSLVSFFLRRWILRRIRLTVASGAAEPEQPSRRGWSGVLWVLYWVLIIGVYVAGSFLFNSFLLYLYVPLIALLLFVMFHTSNRRFRKKTGKLCLMLALRNLSVCGIVVLVCYLALIYGTCINSIYIYSLDYEGFRPSACAVDYDEDTGVYTLTGNLTPEGGELRILQLTDIHYCGSVTTIFSDRKALDACYALIQEAQPDLIIFTGDIAYPVPAQSFTLNNRNPFVLLSNFMRNIGIPWALVYGNHDTEPGATWSGEDASRYLERCAGVDEGCLYARRQPDIYGRYNQYIQINNQDGTRNRILFLLDTNDYVTDADGAQAYDSVHRDQVQWYEDTVRAIAAEEGRVVPSFVFLHIPLPAFAEAQAALEAGSEDAVYLFGENGEQVSCSLDDHGMFRSMVQNQSTQAVFAGHDHVNNLAVRHQGIDLIYSKSIDYIAYPGIARETAQRGATLIHVYYDGYSVEQLDYGK